MYYHQSMAAMYSKSAALDRIYSSAMELAAICGSAAIADPQARIIRSELANEAFWKWVRDLPFTDTGVNPDYFSYQLLHFVDHIEEAYRDGACTADDIAEVLRSKASLVPMYLGLLLEYHTEVKPLYPKDS